MKKRKYIAIDILSVAVLLLGTVACTDDAEYGSTYNDGAFRFTAGESVYTRAAETGEQFEEGTLYQLFAIDHSTNKWTENLLASMPSDHAVIGKENSDHTITYDGNNKFNNKMLDFYGVTASSTTKTLNLVTGTGAPTIHAEYDRAATTGLPDILWAKQGEQTYNNSGTIQLPFIHTLSKLNLKVQKHEESATNNLSITKIELCDYASGSLDLSTGEFVSSSNETREDNFYTVFEGSQKLETVSAPLTSNGKNVEPTVFPTRKNETTDLSKHSLGIRVHLSNGHIYTYWTKEIALDENNQPIKVNNKEQYRPFSFKPNYEYDVQLTVTDNAMVVTILPRVYDWIPKDESQENTDNLTEIGTPVTFGGVTWMDRNLGATSADPTASEMDWERSRGFYYQFGRSIPYYIKGSMQDPDYEKSSIMYAPKCENASKVSKPYPYIAGKYNENQYSWPNDGGPIEVSTLAKSPKDTNLDFRFVYDSKDNSPTYRDWDNTHEVSATRWKTSKNDPCPKGWRLPTSEEFKKIFPVDIIAGDITFNSGLTYEDEKGWHEIYHSITGKLIENQGGYRVYQETKDDGVYIGIKDKNNWGTIYAIKNQGKSDAYRIKWSIEEVGESYANTGFYQKRTVLVISRYPATSTDKLELTYNYTNYYNTIYSSNHTDYDWEHPSEVLKLPIAGYIHADGNAGLIYAGCETIYWTSDIGSSLNTASSVRIKIRGDQYYKALMRYNLERRGYGCLVRCVRDNSVKE